MIAEYEPEQRLRLIQLAEQAIRDGVARRLEPEVDLSTWPAWASDRRATFVTVYVAGKLNGCIGTLSARRSLADDIARNAYHAAFEDPRFGAVTDAQLVDLSVHIAILGPLAAIDIADEQGLLDEMRVGVDGIVLDDGKRRGTFLPAVWDKLPEPASFLAHLKRKAGLALDEWPETLEVFRFEVEEFERDS